jgi:hypothetical protein
MDHLKVLGLSREIKGRIVVNKSIDLNLIKESLTDHNSESKESSK